MRREPFSGLSGQIWLTRPPLFSAVEMQDAPISVDSSHLMGDPRDISRHWVKVIMKFSIEYKLTGVGWSECNVSADDKSVCITASYLSDVLESLAGAVLAVSRGINVARATFDEEPGEYRWVLERCDNEKVKLQILEFAKLWSGQEDEKGNLIFEAQIPLLVLVRSMVRCLSEVLVTHGAEGYRERWVGHDFPMRTYDALRQALATLKTHPTRE